MPYPSAKVVTIKVPVVPFTVPIVQPENKETNTPKQSSKKKKSSKEHKGSKSKKDGNGSLKSLVCEVLFLF